jgi:branched-chain amino acid transport system permease protein
MNKISLRRLSLLAGVVALAAWPFVFSSAYDLRVFTLAGIYAILVIGYQFIFGHAGALALTQGAFFGLGAYITGLLGVKLGWSAASTLPLSIVGPVLLAAIIAAPVLRLETHYFALATLGIAQILLLVAIRWEPFTGGANGLSGIPGLKFLDLTVPGGLPMVLFVWSVVALAALFSWQTMRGLYGRAFHVMRSDDLLAGSIGIDSARLRAVAFLVSAGFAGLAGALYAHTIRVVSPEVLEFHVMVACLSMAVVGGRTSVAGAILGAVLLVHLPEWFRGLEGYYLIAYGIALLAMIVVAPEGLVGLLGNGAGRPCRRAEPTSIVRAHAMAGSRDRTEGRAAAPLLSIQAVGKRFGGIEALRDVSFDVRSGEILGLIGPNGSGKTTLINIATGLYTADSGRVVFDGRSLAGKRPAAIARLGIARTFQAVHLVEEMLAIDNVAVAIAARHPLRLSRALTRPLRDCAMQSAHTEALAIMDRLGIAEAAWHRTAGLPFGTKRRLEVARALALSPRLVFLDEPAAGLNASERRELALQLKRLAQEGLTLLVVEHNMPFLMSIADRIVCLDEGRRIAEGTPDEIRADPAVLGAYFGTAAAATGSRT